MPRAVVPQLLSADPADLGRGLPLVVVGASGGEGLHQLTALVAGLPASLPAAVLVVLHRPADRRSLLPEILARRSHLPVVAPRQGEPLRAGTCYVADSDHHLTVGAGITARLVPDHRHRNRTVDLLFRGAAEHGRALIVGMVLAGALDDGAAGLAVIRRAGGDAIVLQAKPGTGGMPAAAQAAVPDALAVHDAADAVAALVRRLTVAS